MSVYLSDAEIHIGTLVLYQDTRSLESQVCVVVATSKRGAFQGFVELLLPNGKIAQVNRSYLRRVK